MTDTCTPGNRVKITGIFQISRMSGSRNDASSNKKFTNKIQKPYIRVLGIQSIMNDGSGSFTGFSQPNIS